MTTLGWAGHWEKQLGHSRGCITAEMTAVHSLHCQMALEPSLNRAAKATAMAAATGVTPSPPLRSGAEPTAWAAAAAAAATTAHPESALEVAAAAEAAATVAAAAWAARLGHAMVWIGVVGRELVSEPESVL